MAEQTIFCRKRWLILCLCLLLLPVYVAAVKKEPSQVPKASEMERVRIDAAETGFLLHPSQTPFHPWGFNYDHDRDGRLLEDYWEDEWATVAEDFDEMKALEANVVRVHLQLGKFMSSPETTNEAALERLRELLDLAEETRLYLDLTGLGCYHEADIPAWYDALPEGRRWATQARFWAAVARTCAQSPAVFCYDLMNEPVLPGEKAESEWLLGELDGKFFVQRIALALEGRSRDAVAKQWIDTLVNAIRSEDPDHLITVGAIPWVQVFPNAKPVFYAPEVSANLDFVSIHVYPKTGEVEKAIHAVSAYAIGKPIVIEEMFPLHCSTEELGQFIEGTRAQVAGFIGFYWGKRVEEYAEEADFTSALIRSWLVFFRDFPQ
ncbi:MAG: cellulase family glycosylhydrolase [bacterium]|nr:cellulase family glycosylhydrolase [bacterium]